jgi:hypothetical protein
MVPIRYNVRSVIERRATSLMTILGVALVAMIFVLVFGFAAGLKIRMATALSALFSFQIKKFSYLLSGQRIDGTQNVL